jgi:CARDB protein
VSGRFAQGIPAAAPVGTGRPTFGGRLMLSFFEDVDFDDAAPTEIHEPRRGRRIGRPGGGGPRDPSAGRRHLIIAIVAIVVVIVVGWFWIRACQADAQRRAYENYVTDVNSIVKQSDAIGQKLDDAILDPTATKAKLVSEVRQYAQEQSAVAAAAAKLHDTGRLKGLQSWFETTMNYRTQGLQGMAAALQTTFATKLVQLSAVTDVSAAYGRLYASDVIYSDSFQRPATAALQKANVHGVSLSTSQFADSPRDIYPQYLQQYLQRVATNGSSSSSNTAGQLVGTELVKVIAMPSGKRLTPGTTTTVAASTNLTFEAYVKNSGDVPVTQLEVQFAEQGHPLQSKKIKAISPGGVAHVSFAPVSPTLGIPSKISVRSVPQKTEKNTGNNSARYTVEYQG